MASSYQAWIKPTAVKKNYHIVDCILNRNATLWNFQIKIYCGQYKILWWNLGNEWRSIFISLILKERTWEHKEFSISMALGFLKLQDLKSHFKQPISITKKRKKNKYMNNEIQVNMKKPTMNYFQKATLVIFKD